jgi:hypothetical protein
MPEASNWFYWLDLAELLAGDGVLNKTNAKSKSSPAASR